MVLLFVCMGEADGSLENGQQSKKGEAIRDLIRREFEKGRAEEDPEKIEALKAKCVLLQTSLLWHYA